MLLKLLARIFGALSVGVALSLWMLQNSTALQEFAGNKILTFLSQEWAVGISSSKPVINFFTCSMYLHDGTISPQDGKKFEWSFKNCKIHVSPFSLIFNKRADLYISLSGIKATTEASNEKIDILEHIKVILKQRNSQLNIRPQQISLSNIQADILYNQDQFSAMVPGAMTFNYNAAGAQWMGDCNFKGGQLYAFNTQLCKELSVKGTLTINKKSQDWFFSGASKFVTDLSGVQETYTLSGSLEPQKGLVSFFDAQEKAKLACSWSYPLTVGLKGSLPVSLIQTINRLVTKKSSPQLPAAHGALLLDTVITKKEDRLVCHGSIQAESIVLNDATLPPMTLCFNDNNNQTDLALTNGTNSLQGNLEINLSQKNIALSLTNTQQLCTSKDASKARYIIKPYDLAVKASYAAGSPLQATYRCALTNRLANKQTHIRGAALMQENRLRLKGFTDKGDYNITAALKPYPHIMECSYVINNHDIIALKASDSDSKILEGKIHWYVMHHLLSHSMRHNIMGKNCVFDVKINQQKFPLIEGGISLAQGRFYIPEIHNLIQGVEGLFSLNIFERSATIHNAKITCSKGTITCGGATCKLNSEGEISQLQAPLCVNDLFLNWKKDLYAMTYGTLLLEKKENHPAHVSGTVVVKNALLKRAFFEHQKMNASLGMPLIHFPVTTDIQVLTEQPIKTKTSNLKTNAFFDLQVKSNAYNDIFTLPQITGTIILQDGWLKILNHKLMIESGKIHFIAHNMNDPMVEITAKNRIGKYQVTMQANGSVKKPTITLESTPELTEEQIIGLLFTGSESATLQADLPAMLLQNLDSILFSPERESTTAQVVDTIAKTFKYVQISPNLNAADQNKSILKGSLSFNLTDQVRARIDKNLDLEENLSAQLEYMLTDDINLRFIGEQNGEIGSEFELRFKL